jgi:NAD(P)-dependent dehydrogenase (short-subunit alcohol dehydrogenase family)
MRAVVAPVSAFPPAMTAGAAHLLGERGIRANAVELGALWTAAVADNRQPYPGVTRAPAQAGTGAGGPALPGGSGGSGA